ncbi:tyrosine-type recombinase/integrase [Curtobacterium sp. MCBA15_004]|uniref:tyrosine-type recombinase/integrase n=1 Tax=Curtobacterium sp. MCBA15_004 TaxID=1898733 RepID=UPI0008DD9DF5|nr:tyrosine-type recombinase/integrase [Curtobacterium sp. MCBA15_004]WIA96455.1 tyrosine-type recombinase/integrase [Curtobacterium sp. MCBA15_004]
MANRKGMGALYKDSRGYWTGAVTLPSRDGVRRRKVIRGRDRTVVLNQLEELKRELRDNGDIDTRDVTVKQWFTYWLDSIVTNEVRPKTAERYRNITEHWVIPIIGGKKLRQLSASGVRSVTDAMVREGRSPTTALTAHRIMSVALEWAVREGRISRNPAKLMAAPRKAVSNLDALNLQEALDLYAHVRDAGGPGFALWATTLLTGARRGEVLGLEADRVAGDVLDISWQLQRLTWRHGCNKPCGRKRGADCPDRRLELPSDYEHRQVAGGLFLTRPKSRSGWRTPPLVKPLDGILRAHLEEFPPGPNGFVFTNNGKPIDPSDHSRAWRKLLVETGIEKNVRLHDLRHSTVDLLTLANVSDDVIMQIVGHASRLQTNDYRRCNDVARMRVGLTAFGELFTQPDGGSAGTLERGA